MTTQKKVMDRETADHFYRWLEVNVHEEDRHEAEQKIHALLAEYPSLIEEGKTWTEIRYLAERTL